MGMFGDIMSKIFGQSAKAETPAAGTAAPSASKAPKASPAPSGTMTREGPSPEGPKVEWSAPVDVAAVLDGLAKQNKQKLHWRTSIVDLMKLLGLDSGQAARKKLAEEMAAGDPRGLKPLGGPVRDRVEGAQSRVGPVDFAVQRSQGHSGAQ